MRKQPLGSSDAPPHRPCSSTLAGCTARPPAVCARGNAGCSQSGSNSRAALAQLLRTSNGWSDLVRCKNTTQKPRRRKYLQQAPTLLVRAARCHKQRVHALGGRRATSARAEVVQEAHAALLKRHCGSPARSASAAERARNDAAPNAHPDVTQTTRRFVAGVAGNAPAACVTPARRGEPARAAAPSCCSARHHLSSRRWPALRTQETPQLPYATLAEPDRGRGTAACVPAALHRHSLELAVPAQRNSQHHRLVVPSTARMRSVLLPGQNRSGARRGYGGPVIRARTDDRPTVTVGGRHGLRSDS